MSMDQTNFELSNSHNFLFWIIQILVEVPSHDVDVASQGLEVIIAFFGAKVPSAENMLDLSWHQEFFEFSWQTVAPVWDVQIS